jgi:hypothetical protein
MKNTFSCIVSISLRLALLASESSSPSKRRPIDSLKCSVQITRLHEDTLEDYALISREYSVVHFIYSPHAGSNSLRPSCSKEDQSINCSLVFSFCSICFYLSFVLDRMRLFWNWRVFCTYTVLIFSQMYINFTDQCNAWSLIARNLIAEKCSASVIQYANFQSSIDP